MLTSSQWIARQQRYEDLRREADTYRATHTIRTTPRRPWRWLALPRPRRTTRSPRLPRPGTAM